MENKRFARYAWGVLGYNLLVIVWGAFVRATGSGAGCGDHWPLCNGEVIPRAPALETLIEFSHRLTSGIALLSVVALLIWAYRAYPKGNRVRKAALWTMVLMIVEALIGAGLVLLELVAYNPSIARAYWMAAHLVNTFFLIAAITITAWWASGGAGIRLHNQGSLSQTLLAALVCALFISASGAVTALGDTLIIGGGLTAEDSPVVATLVGLRVYHPILAVFIGIVIVIAAMLAKHQRPSPQVNRFGRAVIGLYVLQLGLGTLNIWLMAPVWLQMVHLMVADAIWICLVLLTASALAVPEKTSVAPLESITA